MREFAFTKAHAVGNDFLVVDGEELAEVGVPESEYPSLARTVCARREGVGADGLEIVFPPQKGAAADFLVRIFNADGSEAEISGNGTRCVAADLIARQLASETVRIATKAGIKTLQLWSREDSRYDFEMDMGRPEYREDEIGRTLQLDYEGFPVTILNVGNPQCALFVDDFSFEWRHVGEQIERHKRFPNRTNVSFVRVLDEHAIEARFWERGVGETSSSGTGATGAAVAAILHKKARSPVRVVTVAGEMTVRWSGEEARLAGPAVVLARGRYFL